MRRIWLSLMMTGAAGLGGTAAMAQTEACETFPVGASEVVCSCTGSESGSVWGSGPYTADSGLCVAARHAGVIGAEGGEIRALALPGQDAYPGSQANGVDTASWGQYGASFDFTKPGPATSQSAAAPQACGPFTEGTEATTCTCTGAESGMVWGSGPYTADSDLCTAARHAGAVGPDGGTITVLGFGGLDAYAGTEANGVQTSDWGAYGASVIFNRN